MSDDIRRRLEEAGRRAAPPPDPAFADALETRLRAAAASAISAAPTPEPSEPPRRAGSAFRRLGLAGGLLGAGAAVALLLAVALGAGRPAVVPELTAPVNVEVALRDGTILEDPDGLRLPDGAVVRVGTGGSARIGDTVLAPGDVATMEAGSLRVDHDQPVGVVGATPSPSPRSVETRAPGHTALPTRTPRPPQATPAPAPTPVPSGPRPTAGRTPVATPAATRPPATATPVKSGPKPTPTPAPAIARPKLHARFVAPSIVRVQWSATPGAASYVLVVSGAPVSPAPRPRYPGGRILGQFSHPPAVALRYHVPKGVVEVRLLVVALRADGRQLVRSRVLVVATGG